MDKVEFVNDFSSFYIEVKREVDNASFMDIATLYAIYRKDIRASRMMESKKENKKATAKQLQYLQGLAERKKVPLTEEKLNSLTKEEASKMIEELR